MDAKETETKITETSIQVYMSAELKEKLRHIAFAEKISMAQAAREAIELYCQED